MEALDDKCQVTYYLIDHVENPLDSIIAELLNIEAANNINSEAITEFDQQWGEVTKMVALYVMQINKGKMILEQAPKHWHDMVKEVVVKDDN